MSESPSAAARNHRDLLVAALTATCEELPGEVAHVPLPFWDESVFRFYLVRNLLRTQPSLKMRREWRRIDLAIQAADGCPVLVEIKFWPLRNLAEKAASPFGSFDYPKRGGPSAQNYNEYKKVLRKLQSVAKKRWATKCAGIAAAYLILVYADPLDESVKPTFGGYYDEIPTSDPIRSVYVVARRSPIDPTRVLTCKLLDIAFT